MSEERNEFTPDLFTLEDEDGNEQVFELLDVLEYEDNTYYALVPYYGDDEDALAQDDGEFVILKTEEVNGEEMLVSIEEDAEYETIGNKFLERLNEIYAMRTMKMRMTTKFLNDRKNFSVNKIPHKFSEKRFDFF